MSVNDPSMTRTTTSEVRGRTSDSFRERTRSISETKPSFATTEFWMTLIGVAALIVVYNAADDASLDLWRTCLLATILGAAYMVSRGFAKSGSHRGRWTETDDRYR